jgi:hypothetical protein
MFLTIFDDLKNVLLSFLGYLYDLFLLAMVKLLPIAVVLIFFLKHLSFLLIMISMQANQRERTSWLLYFLSFFVDPARPLLTYPTCKTNGNLCLCTNNNTIAPPNMTTHHSWQIVSSIRGHVAQGFEFGGALGRVTHHTIASW